MGALLMFSSLARVGRIGAFCNRNVPCHNNNQAQSQHMAALSMSTSSQVQLERVSGDTLGGKGTTLVPQVCLAVFLCVTVNVMVFYAMGSDCYCGAFASLV